MQQMDSGPLQQWLLTYTSHSDRNKLKLAVQNKLGEEFCVKITKRRIEDFDCEKLS